MLHGRAGHDQAVIIIVRERLKRFIELHEMIGAHVRRFVRARLHEVDLHLQRGLRDQAQQLRLGLDLLGHEVEDHHLERAHALTLSLGLFEREDALGVEDRARGQTTGNLDRHALHYRRAPDERPASVHCADRMVEYGATRRVLT